MASSTTISLVRPRVQHPLFYRAATRSLASTPFNKSGTAVTTTTTKTSHQDDISDNGHHFSHRGGGGAGGNIISCSRIFSSMAASSSAAAPPVNGGGGLSNFFDPLKERQKHKSQKINGNAASPTTADNTSSTPTSSGGINFKNEIDLLTTPLASPPRISMSTVRSLASKHPTPLSLSNMYRYASTDKNTSQRLRNAQFLHRELPIRIAQRVMDLTTLPHGLSKTRQVRNVAQRYLLYLDQLMECPCPVTEEEEGRFTELLESFVLDRSSIPQAIARGVSSLKDVRREGLDDRRLQEMEGALYRFFTARVGLRFLTEHHILSATTPGAAYLRKKQSCVIGECRLSEMMGGSDGSALEDRDGEGSLGCIQENVDPVREVQFVAKQVERDCRNCFGMAPRIEIVECRNEKSKGAKFTYVPHHLRYMLAELLKNSCRATVNKHMKEGGEILTDCGKETELQKIMVIVVRGDEDVTFKVADMGGGVPRSEIEKLWTFAHSTLDCDKVPKKPTAFDRNEFTDDTIRGFGLPLARIYARYFGGEITLKSMEGYGVDAYLHLPTLGLECEQLPKKVSQSPGNCASTAADTNEFISSVARCSAFPAALNPRTLEVLSQRAL